MIPVQFITHTTARYDYEESAMLALQGGCRWIQLRIKGASDEEVEPIARRLLAQCREHDATFIIDDRVELVKKVDADGVHVGKKDMPVGEVRAFLGEGFLIGGTANTFEDVLSHYRMGADYIGCGPFRYTDTKQNLSPLLGIEGYRAILEQMKTHRIDIPLCAIGGITREDIPVLMRAGVDGIALSGAILRAENPIEEMKYILNMSIE